MNNQKEELSLAERRYLENEEFNKQNVDEIIIRKNQAAAHRKEHGYSRTFAKLMKKHNCSTPDEWRTLRNLLEKSKQPVSTPKPTPTVAVVNNNKKRK